MFVAIVVEWFRLTGGDGRVHPYEEPAYEVYKLEDF